MIGSQELIQFSEKEGFKNFYPLDKKDFHHMFPMRFFQNLIIVFSKKKSLAKPPLLSENEIKDGKRKWLIKSLSLGLLITRLFQVLGFNHYFYRQILSQELKEWITKANPDYLYAVLSTRHSISFAETIQKEFKIPLIIHIMDDWPATIGNKSIFKKYWNNKINKEFINLLKHTYKRVAISGLMADEYKVRFGGQWLFYHNPVDISFWGNNSRVICQNTNNFVILYSGRLSTGISETLKIIAKTIDEIVEVEGLSVTLKIQSNTKPDWVHNYQNTVFSAYINYENLPILFSSVDLLLLPYDFHGKSYEFIRLSMPTKVTEYMASGTPILIVAPSQTALSKYAMNFGWAHVVSEIDKGVLKQELYKLINNIGLREKYGQQALKIVREKHEIKIVQEAFIKLFND